MEPILATLSVCLILFVVGRQFWCWYFKLTPIHEELKAITAELRALRAAQAPPAESQEMP